MKPNSSKSIIIEIMTDFARLTGLELKMEQYRLGEQFAQVVVERRGLPFLQQVWEPGFSQ
jgi:uncharacterized protein (DUF2342 family)